MSDSPLNLSKIKQTLKENGLQIKKSLGQNYLINQHYLGEIAKAILKEKRKYPDSLIIEIGCGWGVLSRELLKETSVLGIEIDKNNCQILKKELGNFINPPTINPPLEPFKKTGKDNYFQLLNEDVLKVRLPEIISPQQKIIVVGNLPYHLVTKIIFHFLENYFTRIRSMTLLMQREVGEKLRSGLGEKNYGIPSLLTQYHTTPQKILEIPPTAFYPIPKIKSELVQFMPQIKKAVINYPHFKDLIQASFHLRRKNIYNSIKAYPNFTFDLEKLSKIFSKLAIDKNRRGESLSLTDYIAVANAYEEDLS